MADSTKNSTESSKDKVTEDTSAASPEAKKATANDSNKSFGDRILHSFDAIKEKFEDKKPEKPKEPIKNDAEHESKNFMTTFKEKAAGAFHFVAGNEGEGKSLVGTVKEKATGAYNFVADKVTEATQGAAGAPNKEETKDSKQPTGETETTTANTAKDKSNEKANEVKVEGQAASF